MKLTLAFENTGTEIELPEGLSTTVLTPRFAAAWPSPETAVSAAVDNPGGSAALAELARGKRSAAIPSAKSPARRPIGSCRPT